MKMVRAPMQSPTFHPGCVVNNKKWPHVALCPWRFCSSAEYGGRPQPALRLRRLVLQAPGTHLHDVALGVLSRRPLPCLVYLSGVRFFQVTEFKIAPAPPPTPPWLFLASSSFDSFERSGEAGVGRERFKSARQPRRGEPREPAPSRRRQRE